MWLIKIAHHIDGDEEFRIAYDCQYGNERSNLHSYRRLESKARDDFGWGVQVIYDCDTRIAKSRTELQYAFDDISGIPCHYEIRE